MGASFRDDVQHGCMMARGERDECAGFQAFRIARAPGAAKGTGTRTFTGPVRATPEAATADAIAAFEAELPRE